MSAASARMQMDMRGRGTWGSLEDGRLDWCDTRDGGENKYALDGTRETLVTLGIVVLETNLELDGLNKVAPLLAVGLGEELLDRAPHA